MLPSALTLTIETSSRGRTLVGDDGNGRPVVIDDQPRSRPVGRRDHGGSKTGRHLGDAVNVDEQAKLIQHPHFPQDRRTRQHRAPLSGIAIAQRSGEPAVHFPEVAQVLSLRPAEQREQLA